MIFFFFIISFLDSVEWAGAWSYKMESFGQLNPSENNIPNIIEGNENCDENVQLCAYCGFEERFLGNQFVMVRYVSLIHHFYFLQYMNSDCPNIAISRSLSLLSLSLSVCLSLSFSLTLYLSIYLPISLSLSLTFYLSIYPSLSFPFLSLSLSIYIYITNNRHIYTYSIYSFCSYKLFVLSGSIGSDMGRMGGWKRSVEATILYLSQCRQKR